MTLLALRDVLVRFGSLTAIDRVSLVVEPGEIVGLLGANGAGKTTAIRAALGLVARSGGAVTLRAGRPSRATRRGVGYVPQTLGLWHDLTVAQNLAFVAGAYGVAPPPLPSDLADIGDRPVGALPLGRQRRVAFAAALCHSPDLLILDEPTSGVGPLERTALWDGIHAAREDAVGVLVTTHHMSEAEQCDRVVVLIAGRVAAEGTIAALLDRRDTVVVTATDWPAAFARLDAAFDAVALQGRDIRVPDTEPEAVRHALGDLPATLSRARASFDEVFVAMGRGL